MNKLVTVHILLSEDYIDGDEISFEEAFENNLAYNDFILDWAIAEKGDKAFNFEDYYVSYDPPFIVEEDLKEVDNDGTENSNVS